MDNATRYLVPVYLAYSAASLLLTVWLARTLARNGAVFLEDVFRDNPRLAEAVNKLLVVGFYLFNLGYALQLLKSDHYAFVPSGTPVIAIETLAEKLGTLLLVLAAMHFVNLFIFQRIRRRARIEQLPPPVAPSFNLSAA
jgi:hypothetical protein